MIAKTPANITAVVSESCKRGFFLLFSCGYAQALPLLCIATRIAILVANPEFNVIIRVEDIVKNNNTLPRDDHMTS